MARALGYSKPAAPPAPPRGRGAVREGPGRIVGDGVQAEPDARGADRVAQPVCDRAVVGRGDDGGDPVVRADAGRARGDPETREDSLK